MNLPNKLTMFRILMVPVFLVLLCVPAVGEAMGETALLLTTAAVFGISKSTVHKDLTERLERIDLPMARRVRRILDRNKAQRHLRGGEATRQKYRAAGRREKYGPQKD